MRLFRYGYPAMFAGTFSMAFGILYMLHSTSGARWILGTFNILVGILTLSIGIWAWRNSRRLDRIRARIAQLKREMEHRNDVRNVADLKMEGSWPTFWSELDGKLSPLDFQQLMIALSYVIATLGQYDNPYMPQVVMMKMMNRLGLLIGRFDQATFTKLEAVLARVETNYRQLGYLKLGDEQSSTLPAFSLNNGGDSTF